MNALNAVPIMTPAKLAPLVRPGFPEQASAPTERGSVLYMSENGAYACGFWEGDAGKFDIPQYPVTEFCHVLDGEVTLVNNTGERASFGPGQSFVIPLGFVGSWEMTKTTRKFFVSHGDPTTLRAFLGLS
jgi:uncharacterized cupin superfamily protein